MPDGQPELSLDEFREKARERYGIPKGLWESLRGQESGGDVNAVSPTGVRGEMQVTKATARGYGLDRDDPFHQVVAAAKNLREGYDKYAHLPSDNQRWLAAAGYYYGGPDAVKADGTLSTSSKDNLSNPSAYVTNIARRWKAYNDSQSGQQQPTAPQQPKSPPPTTRRLGMKPAAPQPRPVSQRSPDSIGYDKQGRSRSKVLWELVRSFEDAKKGGRDLEAKELAGDIKANFGDVMEVGSGSGGWPYVKPRRASKFQYSMEDVRAAPVPNADEDLRQQELAKRREEFSQKPLTSQISERAIDAFARGGGQISKMARQASGAGLGVAQGLAGGDFTPVDFPEWRKREEETNRILEERRQGRPSSFVTDVGEGVIEAIPSAAAAIGGTLATGGGLPAAALIGGGMNAAGADWRDPKRAAAQAALSAASTVLGGKLGSAVGGRIASRLASPIGQALARAGGEIVGGGVGNATGSGAEQLAFEGQVDPRELARQAAIGAALSAPGVVSAGRIGEARQPGILSGVDPAILESAAKTPTRAPRLPRPTDRTGQAAADFGNRLEEIDQTVPASERPAAIEQARQAFRPGRVPPAAQPVTGAALASSPQVQEAPLRVTRAIPQAGPIEAQPNAPTTQAVPQSEPPIPALNENLIRRSREKADKAIQEGRTLDAVAALKGHKRAIQQAIPLAKKAPGLQVQLTEWLARVDGEIKELGKPTSAKTPKAAESPQNIAQPQVSPDVLAAENAPTAVSPQPEALTRVGQGSQTPANVQRPSQSDYPPIERRTAEIRPQASVNERVESVARGTEGNRQANPQRSLAGNREGLVQEPTNRITEGVGSEMPTRYSRPLEGQPVEISVRSKTERLPVPKATAENRATLVRRAEELRKLAENRRGEFPADLRDELGQLNAAIRDYDIKNSPRQIGEPAGLQPERGPNPQERAARREALQARPRESGLLQSSRPGQAVTRESQMLPGSDPKTAFKSREDARQGYFDTLTDDELLADIRRMEDVENQKIRGRSRLSPEELEANRFDLRVARQMQTDRRVIQKQQGRDEATMIPPRTPSRGVARGTRAAESMPESSPSPTLRKIQHSRFGEVAESADQSGVAKGMLRVTEAATGKDRIIKNPRARGGGNQSAAFVKEAVKPAITETPPRREGQIMGSGFGSLQGLFERKTAKPTLGQQALFNNKPKVDAKRIGREAINLLNLPRSVMSSADLSAPLRQGAILSLPPTQWGRAAKSGLRMLQALKTSEYNRLVNEMNSHPDAKVGKASGLYMSTDPAKGAKLSNREESFVSEWAEKIPVVKHSEQAYKTYLDSIRLETFRKYKRVIDSDKKLSFEDREKAYKAAADWINVASGRGSLGKTLDNAMPALSAVFFSPRYTASRLQVLNPMTYLKNSTTPAGRAVLKQQMADLAQFAGVTATTLALAKAAGADVSLDRNDTDFLKIKVGNKRYDTLAGLQQMMRLFYGIGKDIKAVARNEKSEKGKNTVEILGHFGRSKLAPIPSFFTDMLTRKDFSGRKFEMGRAVADRVFPLMWKDFYDAAKKEGFGSAAGMLPGALGVGVQNYEERPGTIKLSSGLESEFKKHGLDYGQVSEIKGDTEETHKARVERVQNWLTTYGDRLTASPRYKALSEDQQKAALTTLHKRITSNSNQKSPRLYNLAPFDIIQSVRQSERSKPSRDRKKIVVAED